MKKISVKQRIIDSAQNHKSRNGKVIASHVAFDVFGGNASSQRRAVNKVLDDAGIDRVVKPQKKTSAQKAETIDVSNTSPETLDVELYLAFKAKTGCRKAFALLQRLV